MQPVQAGEADMSQSGALRETYGLRQQSLTEKQRSVQRERADKNAGKAGTITKAVNAVKQLLSSIISKAKEILTIDPENRAALHAKNLAQAQKKALQDVPILRTQKRRWTTCGRQKKTPLPLKATARRRGCGSSLRKARKRWKNS